MKMKLFLGLIAGLTLMVSSCATSNEVNGGGVFQKRKYTKGFYWSRVGSSPESVVKIENENWGDADLTASTEQIENQDGGIMNAFDAEQSEQTVSKHSTKGEERRTEKMSFFANTMIQNPLNQSINPIKKVAIAQSKFIQNKARKAKVPRNDGQLGYLLGVILLVILLLLLFTILDAILGGLLMLILRIAVFVLIIILLLRLLGVI